MTRPVRLLGLCALPRFDLLQPYFDRRAGLRGPVLCSPLGRIRSALYRACRQLHFQAVHLLPQNGGFVLHLLLILRLSDFS